jgi:hypothetical protein
MPEENTVFCWAILHDGKPIEADGRIVVWLMGDLVEGRLMTTYAGNALPTGRWALAVGHASQFGMAKITKAQMRQLPTPLDSPRVGVCLANDFVLDHIRRCLIIKVEKGKRNSQWA